jgi:hypothetical protein
MVLGNVDVCCLKGWWLASDELEVWLNIAVALDPLEA